MAARILAQFPERLTPAQRVRDTLAELGAIVKTPGANVIKLPNISASVPQLVRGGQWEGGEAPAAAHPPPATPLGARRRAQVAAIAELQAKGYNVPPYTQTPTTAEEKEIAAKCVPAPACARAYYACPRHAPRAPSPLRAGTARCWARP